MQGQAVPACLSAADRGETGAVADADVTSRRSPRSPATLTYEHLRRLAALADADHDAFTRPGGRPEYRSRRLTIVLAQGAALHYFDGHTGVKDLDVWTFYAGLPATRFPADKRETHADFGPSTLGRQSYDFAAARSARERALWRRWSAYSGRRADFLCGHSPSRPAHRSVPWSRRCKSGWHAVPGARPLTSRPRGISRRRPSCSFIQSHAVVR
jgi:hypothetical protein